MRIDVCLLEAFGKHTFKNLIIYGRYMELYVLMTLSTLLHIHKVCASMDVFEMHMVKLRFKNKK